MKTIGIISTVYGSFGILMNLIGLIAISFQRIVIKAIPFSELKDAPFDIKEFITSIHSVGFIFIPLAIIIGIMFLISGIKMINDKPDAVTLTRFSSIFDIIWYISYIIVIYLTLVPVFSELPPIGERVISMVIVLSGIIGTIFSCGYPVFLLIYLRKK